MRPVDPSAYVGPPPPLPWTVRRALGAILPALVGAATWILLRDHPWARAAVWVVAAVWLVVVLVRDLRRRHQARTDG